MADNDNAQRSRDINVARASAGLRFSSRIVTPLALGADILCLVLAAPIALLAHKLVIGGGHDATIHVAVALICGIAFLLIRISRDSYTQSLAQGRKADQGVVFDYFIAALLCVSIIWQLGAADEVSRALMLFYTAACMALLFLSRFALWRFIRYLADADHIAQRMVLFGADQQTATRALRLLQMERLPHLKVVGIADDRATRVRKTRIGEVPYIGGFPELLKLARRNEIDQVLIAIADVSQERLDEIVEALSEVAVDVSLVPREALVLSSGYKLSFIGNAPILSIWERPVRDGAVFLKAAEDKVIAVTALALLSPLLVLTALAVKLTSAGPIFFAQKRFGFNNVEISVWKFRSMYIDRQDVTGEKRTTKADPRITPVGRVIRRLSIDEIPQLWNVLKGEMSIVGPRPHATHMKVGDRFYFDAVRGYAARHRVKPGLTGLAQVRGLRGEIDSLEKARKRVDYDCYYVDNWSLMLDIRIIIETCFKLFSDRNAY